jgi:hypothetical protein
VSPVKYELGFYIPEDDTLHSHRRGNLKFYRHVCRLRVSTSTRATGRLKTLRSVSMIGYGEGECLLESVHLTRLYAKGNTLEGTKALFCFYGFRRL